MIAPTNRRIVLCGLTAMFAACSSGVLAQGVPDYAEIVAAPDRSAAASRSRLSAVVRGMRSMSRV